MADESGNPDNKGAAELQALQRLRTREEEGSRFSLGKGLLLGIVGKVAGTAVVTTAQEGFKNKLKNELLQRPDVLEALGNAKTPAESESAIKGAMKNAITDMGGLRGSMLRNKWAWKWAGGAGAGLGLLGLEYGSHLEYREEAQQNINDLKKLEASWTGRLTQEQQKNPQAGR